eukprot:162007_1
MSDFYGDLIVFDLLSHLTKTRPRQFGDYSFLNFDGWLMDGRVSLEPSDDPKHPLTYTRPLIDNVFKYIKWPPHIPTDATFDYREQNTNQIAVMALIDMLFFNDDRTVLGTLPTFGSIGNQGSNGATNVMLHQRDPQSPNFEYLPIDNGFGFVFIMNTRHKQRKQAYDLDGKMEAWRAVIKFAREDTKAFATEYLGRNKWLYNGMKGHTGKTLLRIGFEHTFSFYGDEIVGFIERKVSQINPETMINDIIKSKCRNEFSSLMQRKKRKECEMTMKQEYNQNYDEYIQSVKTMRDEILKNIKLFKNTKHKDDAKLAIDNEYVNDGELEEYEMRLQRLIYETERKIHRDRY